MLYLYKRVRLAHYSENQMPQFFGFRVGNMITLVAQGFIRTVTTLLRIVAEMLKLRPLEPLSINMPCTGMPLLFLGPLQEPNSCHPRGPNAMSTLIPGMDWHASGARRLNHLAQRPRINAEEEKMSDLSLCEDSSPNAKLSNNMLLYEGLVAAEPDCNHTWDRDPCCGRMLVR